MSDAPWRATLDGVVVACRLTPKGGRDAIDGVGDARRRDDACCWRGCAPFPRTAAPTTRCGR